MWIRYVGAVLVVAAFLGTARAEEYDGSPSDRYTIVEMANGIVRVDKETGEISSCTEQSGGWTCLIAADEREAYLAEIDRLSRQNEALADKLAALQRRIDELETGKAGDKKTPSSSDFLRYFQNPPPLSEKDEKELKQFLDTSEKAFRGFFGVMRELEKEFKDKGAK